ncbi:hypothetical protein A2714_02690 [Candidatus Woesebacteria bacterium RIFCSPHIGHO2_01_FULL_38_9]|uniref:Glycosyltransferase RgtA/B/C/D-like domain-containing protein n=2 Tax=Candidatus Woeseibacteriota TaxID=1752722 RepID=A0A1F7Y4C0_9BACT|nr:MAG: hypothetical protein A2714_02690 [Candidatus Woesebacteria bacterium RIFCSPHIGHO2_01_FULL_38_9]OGM59688.1 MAG: hypothetical protein A3A75_00900 [Candidatus Woesebacteria bacterium RIFCSPLOWO2_01_FULL_39_10]
MARYDLKKSLSKIPLFEILLFTFFFFFSSLLMWKTFRVDSEGNMQIANHAWSDFAASIPLIRSFSFGSNFPIEHPLFPGEPIRYHFLFYLLVGILERFGLRIDFALNGLSSISFALLLFMIYLLAKTLFQKRSVGILSVFLFLFNGSLSFIEFFKLHPLSTSTFSNIIHASVFPSFGPYDGKIVSAFWNLNIYTNQRHLALSFALSLLTIYLLYCKFNFKNKLTVSLSVLFILVTLVLLNKAVFIITLPFIAWFIVLKPQKRAFLILTFFLGTAFFLLVSTATKDFGTVRLKLGFLINEPLTLVTFIRYWFYNFGLYTILIPIGCLLCPKKARRLILPLLAIFVYANIFQFSTDIINNHKFFNFFLIFGSMYAANFLIYLSGKNLFKSSVFGKTIAIILIFFLTISGVIDLFAILNDRTIKLGGISTNPDVYFFAHKTQPRSVVLNSNFLYHPASIAGRPIFHGYPYFTWSYGYDKEKREKILISIYRSRSKSEACNLLLSNNISYVELDDNPERYIMPNWELWNKEFDPIYRNPNSGISVYEVNSSCNLSIDQPLSL